MLPLKAILVGAWFGVLALSERLAPAVPRPRAEARLFRNLGLWALNTAMSPFVTVPIGFAAAGLSGWRPDGAGWAWLIIDLILLDLWTYSWHRANHEWPLLWRFHRAHHLDQFLDTTSAVRFHPGEVLISALARAPLIVGADVGVGALLVFDALVLAAALFHHSNLRLPAGFERGLRWFLVTPSHHWVHHHAVRADTDSNYATLLTIWDRLFRSWSPTPRKADLAIGTEGAADTAFVALVVSPFRAHRPGRGEP